jgi:thiosulfate/3-mercaptopyruvate sulfurtransferase
MIVADPPEAAMDHYPNPDILVDTDWLDAHRNDRTVRIIDCRLSEPYLQGHIPGAAALHDSWLKNPSDPLHVITPEQARDVLGGLGIDDETFVVLYDGQGGTLAARVWWVLDYYGHTRAALLDGGWQKWVAEGRETTTRVPLPNPKTFTPRPNPAVICSLDDVRASLGDSGVVIWDVRRPGEYTGEQQSTNPRGGHIPGARNLDWFAVLTPEDPKVFRPAAEIRQLLETLGMTPEKEVLTH